MEWDFNSFATLLNAASTRASMLYPDHTEIVSFYEKCLLACKGQ